MLRLGSIVLSSVLLGVPRALGARVPGGDRSGYVDVAAVDLDPRELAGLLERVLSLEALAGAREPSGTLVVEVHRIARLARDPARGALLATLGEGRRRRPLVVDHKVAMLPAREEPRCESSC